MHVSAQASNAAYLSLSTVNLKHDKTYEDSIHNEQKGIKCEHINNKKGNIGMSSNSSCDTEDEVRKPLGKS